LLSVVAGAIAVIVDQMWRLPPTDATASEVLDFATTNRSALLVAMLLNTAAVTLWLVFGAGVWSHLRQHARGESLRSACFGAAFVSFNTLLLAGFTCMFVIVYRAPVERDSLLLYDLTFALLAMSGAPTAVALWAYAGDVFRTRTLPVSTAWFAVIGAVAHLALFASLIVRDGFWSLQGPLIMVVPGTLIAWITATSIALLRSAR
jgi:hypothetical protein